MRPKPTPRTGQRGQKPAPRPPVQAPVSPAAPPAFPDDYPAPHSAIRLPYRTEVGRKAQLDRAGVEALRFREVNASEAFTLQDASGRFFRASLLSCGDKGAEALIYEEIPRSPESPIRLSLFCAVLARQRMMLVVQKATELGAAEIIPILTQHSVPPEGLAHEKAHAWPGVAVRASRQCRRATVPLVQSAIPLSEALAGERWSAAAVRFYLDDRAGQGAPLDRVNLRESGPSLPGVCLAVGPEGGWSDEERAALQASGAAPLALGGRVLRAETAVLAGLVLLQHRLGDL